MSDYGTCPNAKCSATISGNSDVNKFVLTSTRDQTIYAVTCKHCNTILGTAPQAR